jgi:hypothetical protein
MCGTGWPKTTPLFAEGFGIPPRLNGTHPLRHPSYKGLREDLD